MVAPVTFAKPKYARNWRDAFCPPRERAAIIPIMLTRREVDALTLSLVPLDTE